MVAVWLKPETQPLVYALIVKLHASVVAEKYVIRVMVAALLESLKLILVRLIALGTVRMDAKVVVLESARLVVKADVIIHAKIFVEKNVKQIVLLNAHKDA